MYIDKYNQIYTYIRLYKHFCYVQYQYIYIHIHIHIYIYTRIHHMSPHTSQVHTHVYLYSSMMLHICDVSIRWKYICAFKHARHAYIQHRKLYSI